MPTSASRKGGVPPIRLAERPAHGSRNQSVYQAIRAAIERGELKPGQRIMELEIGAWLGMSRTPVREALRRLETEGMLELEPRVGLVVASLDRQAVMELYAMRELLEVTAAGLCAVNATRLEIVELEALVRREQSLQDDADALVRHNRLFHDAIHAGAHNRFLTKSLNAVNDSMWLLGASQMRLAHRARAALKEHAAIFTAIERHDRAAAESAARTHVQGAQRERMKALFPQSLAVQEQ
jgi:DNA-binding GntR family transcriptional regulator